MPHVLVVNPIEGAKPLRKRRSKKGVRNMAKKARSAAQRAATRKMIAVNKARRRAASPKRKARRRNPVAPLANPRRTVRASKARRSSPKRRTSASAASSAGRTLRFRRKNPVDVGFLSSFTRDTLMPSAIGGAGALGLDVLIAVAPIPDAMKSGPFKPVVRVAGAVALGMLAGFVTSERTAQQVTAGAVTVVLYDTMKAMMAQIAGGKIPGVGVYEIPGVGVYEIDSSPTMTALPGAIPSGMGYQASAQQVGE